MPKIISKKLIGELYRELVDEMDLDFTKAKNLELFDFILNGSLSKEQLEQLKEYVIIRALFYEMFRMAIQEDTSFKKSRLIFDVFLGKISLLFNDILVKKLIIDLNESLPRFFKNLILGKHKKYRKLTILDLKERFNKIFRDVLIPPNFDEIKRSILVHIKKNYPYKFISVSEVENKISDKRRPIILDASFVLEELQRDKKAFYDLLVKGLDSNCFIIPSNIFEEIVFHFEYLDHNFVQLLNIVWFCTIEKETILELRREMKTIDTFRDIYRDHEHYSFLNDLSLVVLGRHLSKYHCLVVSRDLNLSKILNYYKIACDTQLILET